MVQFLRPILRNKGVNMTKEELDLWSDINNPNNDADMDAYIKKVYDFIASYKSNTTYTDILQSSTTTQESVQERLAYWNKMI